MSILQVPQVQVASKVYSVLSQIFLPILIVACVVVGIKYVEEKTIVEDQAKQVSTLTQQNDNLTTELQKAKDQITQMSDANKHEADVSVMAKSNYDQQVTSAKDKSDKVKETIVVKWKDRPVATTADSAIEELRANAIELKTRYVGSESRSD